MKTWIKNNWDVVAFAYLGGALGAIGKIYAYDWKFYAILVPTAFFIALLKIKKNDN